MTPVASPSGGSIDLDDEGKAAFETLGRNLVQSAQTAVQGETTRAAVQATDAIINFWLPGFLEGAPAWTRRFEFEWGVQDNNQPEFSILTVQPLFQDAAEQNTFFTQLRIARNHQFGDGRTTTNAGLGYRRLLFDNTLLVGANSFFDYEWEKRHSRISVGGELKWSGFDLFASQYWGLSSKHTAGADTFEEPLSGHDIELTAQLPYLPWARIRGRRFWWDTKLAAEDVEGWNAGVEIDIHQNLQLEIGVTDDNFNDFEYFLQLRFRLQDPARPVMLSSKFFDDQAFSRRDMRNYTLYKVRRENEIVLERSATGVVIVRAN